MRKLIYIFVIVLLSGCQQARFVDEWPEDSNNTTDGRNSQAGPGDSTTVKPNFETEDWEGTIDINFGFGSEETE